MTVKELIEELQAYPMNSEVVIQQDTEGSGFHFAYATELAIDDKNHGYPSEYDIDEIYGKDEDIPKERVVVIV
jgi:hypothetical protein